LARAPGERKYRMTQVAPGPEGRKSELHFHPLADIFPLMEGAEFDELVEDIKANGLRDPIVLFEGKILDGRNRYRACLKAGVDPYPECHVFNYPGDDPTSFVISKNIHRRHLTAEQKRDVIVKLIKTQPERSNRQIAKEAGVSHTHINKVRAEMEEAGDVETVSTSIDTKGRKQPAKKAKAERNRKARERRAAAHAAKRKREAEERDKQYEIEEAQAKAKAEQLAADLIKAGLARRVLAYMTWEDDHTLLQDALEALVTEKRKAETAAFNEAQNDPGPIPACLVRAARDGAS
jgi:ParB-like chromosome segregation protein Spo0J